MLRRIAYDTGGRAIVNTNNPADQLQNVIADASAYYLVGYTPTRTANDGKFHRIEVKVKRRGVKVTARRGYWAASEKEMTAAAEAAATPVNVGLPTALAALSQPSSTRRRHLDRGCRAAPARHEAHRDLGGEPGGDTSTSRRVSRFSRSTTTGKPSMEAQVIAGAPGEIPMIAQFELAPGRQRLRFTSLTSAGDTIDRWIQTMTIPALSNEPIVLSTPRFLRARNMIELRAIEANPAPAPTAATRFRPSDRVLVEIECATAPGATPVIKVELLNAKGDVLKPLPAPDLADGRMRMVLPVGSLAPSTYVLKVTATIGEQSAEQWAAFRLAP